MLDIQASIITSMSKAHGGMGFRNLQAFNLAMLAKQAWRILANPTSLVARIYTRQGIFPTVTFWGQS